jgi:hypothetical protein
MKKSCQFYCLIYMRWKILKKKVTNEKHTYFVDHMHLLCSKANYDRNDNHSHNIGRGKALQCRNEAGWHRRRQCEHANVAAAPISGPITSTSRCARKRNCFANCLSGIGNGLLILHGRFVNCTKKNICIFKQYKHSYESNGVGLNKPDIFTPKFIIYQHYNYNI